MRKGRKKDLRKFDVYEIVIRMFATIVCAMVAVIVYMMVLYAPALCYFSGQVVNELIVEMSEVAHPEDNVVPELTLNSSMVSGLEYLGTKSLMESAPAHSESVIQK